MTRFNHRNDRKNDMIIIFVSNINVVAQNNFNYIQNDFLNKKRENRENDHENDREDFNFN